MKRNLLFLFIVGLMVISATAPVSATTPPPPECIPNPTVEFDGSIAHFDAKISSACTPYDPAYIGGNPANDYELLTVVVVLHRRTATNAFIRDAFEVVATESWNPNEIANMWTQEFYYDFSGMVNIDGYGSQYEYRARVIILWGVVPWPNDLSTTNQYTQIFHSEWIPGPAILDPTFEDGPDDYVPETRDDGTGLKSLDSTSQLKTQ